MKGFSIKARVTLWYTCLLLALLALGSAYLLAVSGQVFQRQIQQTLLDVVSDTVKNVHFERGELEEDRLDFYRNGVSIFLYDTSGRLIAPKVNRGIQVDSILEDQEVKKVENGKENWLVHDLYAVQGDTAFWVRGIYDMSGSSGRLRGMALGTLVGVPALALVAAVGGWLITRHAFSSIGRMAEAANAITSGSDLSQRLPENSSQDELSQLSRTINYMLERLQASFERERQFTSDASHELQTPTAVIISQCEYALLETTAPPEKEDCLQTILRQARQMSALISQLLLLSRLDSGRFQPAWEQVDWSMLCEMSVEEFQDAARAAQVELTACIVPEVILTGDETLLIRLTTNLLSNAVRYNRPGGRVELSLQQEENQCVLTVTDTGVGIREEEQDKVWNRFYQGDTSRRSGGAGLGLSMVQWIAVLHGGEVSLQSVFGVGSRFSVTLPLQRAELAESGKK